MIVITNDIVICHWEYIEGNTEVKGGGQAPLGKNGIWERGEKVTDRGGGGGRPDLRENSWSLFYFWRVGHPGIIAILFHKFLTF